MKVINEIREQTKQFNSVEEFDLYYRRHKEDMDGKTTQYLNRVYKIKCSDGTEYRITKKNCLKQDGKLCGGEIYLKKVVNKQSDDDDLNDVRYANLKVDITNMNEQINELKQQIDSMKQTINEMIRVINGT